MEDQGGKGPSRNTGLKRLLTMNPSCLPKKILSWFQFLLLLSMALLFLCYIHSIPSSPWWEKSLLHQHYQKLINQSYQSKLPPPFRVDPNHLAKADELPETTSSTYTTLTARTLYHQDYDPNHLAKADKLPETTSSTNTTLTARTLYHQVYDPNHLTKADKLPETTSSTYTTLTARTLYHQVYDPNHLTKADKLPETTSSTYTTLTARTLYHQAYAPNYRFIMDVGDVCKNNTPFLVLMVPVEPGNKEAREAIRLTWGKEKSVQGETILTLFMLGLAGGAEQQQKVIQENKLHHDLIQSNFVDSYLNLTIKTMVIMEWLATRCPTAAYAMKVDSDMFLNIDNLVLMLQKPGIPKTNYLTGRIMWDIPVIRVKSSKWYVPEEMYPDPKYPTYTLGMGYVFSNDLPPKFVAISKTIRPFNIEDAYIGMCMNQLGLVPIPPPDASQFQAYNTEYNRCEYSRIITYILQSPHELINYWMDLWKKPGPPC
ncbi:beta-1,3-galactosyltransferase 1-like [Nerophis ophidion]|uniref:beta-1,3-galactosyltransferase 1-like n=1 Tax=Nerophis ophidion TaxID=159077 RepID=UPI002AE01BD4|nr:beta-1,3-galactosyltransferase 1-like [Nerophis ophidion]